MEAAEEKVLLWREHFAQKPLGYAGDDHLEKDAYVLCEKKLDHAFYHIVYTVTKNSFKVWVMIFGIYRGADKSKIGAKA